MQKIKNHSKPLALLMVILILTVTSAKNALALGNYTVANNVTATTTQELETAGEPAAVAIALVVGAAFVFAAGVAFALGVYDGVHSNLGEQLASIEMHQLEIANYHSTDFSSFDN